MQDGLNLLQEKIERKGEYRMSGPMQNAQQNRRPDINYDEIDQEVNKILNIGNVDENGSEMIEIAAKYAKKSKNRLTVTQIRKIFNDISKLDSSKEDYKYRLNLILVNFIYNSRRSNYPEDFEYLVERLIKLTVKKGKEELKRFKDFFEAFVAYHKAYGGK